MAFKLPDFKSFLSKVTAKANPSYSPATKPKSYPVYTPLFGVPGETIQDKFKAVMPTANVIQPMMTPNISVQTIPGQTLAPVTGKLLHNYNEMRRQYGVPPKPGYYRTRDQGYQPLPGTKTESGFLDSILSRLKPRFQPSASDPRIGLAGASYANFASNPKTGFTPPTNPAYAVGRGTTVGESTGYISRFKEVPVPSKPSPGGAETSAIQTPGIMGSNARALIKPRGTIKQFTQNIAFMSSKPYYNIPSRRNPSINFLNPAKQPKIKNISWL